jgi:hypothetical protein
MVATWPGYAAVFDLIRKRFILRISTLQVKHGILSKAGVGRSPEFLWNLHISM